MINFDSLTLTALMRELKPVVENARIQKIRQPSRQELILTLRNNSKNYNLFVSIKPSFAHLCVLEDDYKNFRIMNMPQSPPMFCMLLRKYMEGVKIEKILQPEHERIIEFYFTSTGELGERIPLVLAIELMGKHSNMILYNAKTKIILGCAHNVGEEKSKERELAGGLLYVYPPKRYKKDILNIDEQTFLSLCVAINGSFSTWLNGKFYDISIPLAKEICKKYDLDEYKNCIIEQKNLLNVFYELKSILSLNNIQPSISADFEDFTLTGLYSNRLKNVNLMVDLYFGRNSYIEIIERKKKSLTSLVDRELKKIKRLIKKLSLNAEYEQKTTMYKQIADTLMANMYMQNPHKNKIELTNVHTNEKIEIDIDERLSINDNAQNYYKIYAKSKRTKENNEILFEKYSEKEEYLLSIKSSLQLANDMEVLDQIEEEIQDLNPQNFRNKHKKENNKIKIEMLELENFQIYIGKNNRQNDYIISKIASPEDFWFHVHSDFGSHILVKPKYKTDKLPDTLLLKAATLAAKFSARKTDKKVNVIYTKRKYLRKPPAANLGYVTYKNEKEITVEL